LDDDGSKPPTDLFGGQIHIMVADVNTGLPLPRDRNPALTDLPTLSKTVIDWTG
jgi:hypothetical protein